MNSEQLIIMMQADPELQTGEMFIRLDHMLQREGLDPLDVFYEEGFLTDEAYNHLQVDEWNRTEPTRAVLKRMGPAAIPSLIYIAQSPVEMMFRVRAMWGLKKIDDFAAVSALIRIVEDRSEKIRALRHAIRTLRIIGDPRAIPALIRLQKEADAGASREEANLWLECDAALESLGYYDDRAEIK